jgi:hypothetical protein
MHQGASQPSTKIVERHLGCLKKIPNLRGADCFDDLRGLPQPEEQIKEWRLAWDELTDVRLESHEEDTEGAIQRKRPDAWAVNWEERNFLNMEFTRPNDRGELSLHETDTLKKGRYPP